MKKDIGSSDLMRIMGLAPRKKNAEQAKYGRFNRRMMAATIDSLLLIPLIPIITPIFEVFYGPPPANLEEVQRQARMQPPEEAGAFLVTTLKDAGFFRYWIENTTFQFAVLAALAAICWIFWSASPGKMVMKLKVVDAKTGGKPSVIQCILRASGYFMSGMCFGLGFLWIIIDKRRQGWHDKLADTVVEVVPWAPFKHGKKAQEVKPASEAAAPSDSPAP